MGLASQAPSLSRSAGPRALLVEDAMRDVTLRAHARTTSGVEAQFEHYETWEEMDCGGKRSATPLWMGWPGGAGCGSKPKRRRRWRSAGALA